MESWQERWERRAILALWISVGLAALAWGGLCKLGGWLLTCPHAPETDDD